MGSLSVFGGAIHLPVTPAVPAPAISRRYEMTAEFEDAAMDFANTVLGYNNKLPKCSPLFSTKFTSEPICKEAVDFVNSSESTCGFTEASIPSGQFDAFACACDSSERQPLPPMDRCIDALCGDEDAEKAKKLTREMIKIGGEKCWKAYNIGVGNGASSKPPSNSTAYPKVEIDPKDLVENPEPESGVGRMSVKGALVLGAMFLPVLGMIL